MPNNLIFLAIHFALGKCKCPSRVSLQLITDTENSTVYTNSLLATYISFSDTCFHLLIGPTRLNTRKSLRDRGIRSYGCNDLGDLNLPPISPRRFDRPSRRQDSLQLYTVLYLLSPIYGYLRTLPGYECSCHTQDGGRATPTQRRLRRAEGTYQTFLAPDFTQAFKLQVVQAPKKPALEDTDTAVSEES